MKKAVLITSHLFFWIFTYLSAHNIFQMLYFRFAFELQYPNGSLKRNYGVEDDYRAALIIILIGLCVFYASYFSLDFFVKRPLRFFWLFACYMGYSLVVSLPADLMSASATFDLGPILYFNVGGFLFKACEEWFNDRKLKVELEKDRDASQLELLKSKIDPHFLFNNLNNIDVFIQEDPKLASEYLKKLSDILRFMLYEANTPKIELTKEIEYISKYIDLQKIRTSNINFVKFEINGDATHKRISPMILIHFIENAFKYAANKKIADAIVIKLDITERHLSFFCKNHIGLSTDISPAKNGLGIQLLKQKLDLLYKKNYTLAAKEENNWYIVTLDIQLDED